MTRIIQILLLAACPPVMTVAQQTTAVNRGDLSELYTVRGEYTITPQPDGKAYMLQRLARDGTSIENIVLTKTSGNNPAAEYIDQSGTKYTQLPDGSLREVRVKQAPSPPPQPVRTQPSNPNPAPVAGPISAPPALSAAPTNASPYNGPRSGTLTCDGGRIPQNGEKVFSDLPPLDLNLIYDKKTWDAKLQDVDGQSKRLILTNKKPGEQKKCEVHWQVVSR